MLWLVYHRLGQPGWIDQLPPLFSELLGLAESAAVLTLCAVFFFLLGRNVLQRRAAAQVLSEDDLYALSPSAFERYVAGLFRRKGYKVRVRGRSGDHGVDLELRRPDGKRAIVQCKRYRSTIGPDIVRELFGTLIHERVHHAFLVTTAGISPSAREWAADKPMTLIDGTDLVKIAAALEPESTH